MSNLSILIADTRAALDALAAASGLTILADTARSFDTLTTYKAPSHDDAGSIDTPTPGWTALAHD